MVAGSSVVQAATAPIDVTRPAWAFDELVAQQDGVVARAVEFGHPFKIEHLPDVAFATDQHHASARKPVEPMTIIR